MKKIVLLPLDERPCNYGFPYELFNDEQTNIVRPNLNILGEKKKPGNLEEIKEFLLNETKDADGLVISIDTLLYGGIVPSRLHHDSIETLKERLFVLKELKKQNPKLEIYAFHLIMRSPQSSSDDEEPDYYGICGREIFRTGFLTHKKELGLATNEELKELKSLKVKEEYLNDFLNRRKLNTSMVLESLNLLEENTIDFLIIPQDDAAEFGWTAKDQEVVRNEIEYKTLQLRAYMYPGADEVANSLLSKMVLEFNNKKPLVYLYYPSNTSGSLIPRYEDRMLDTTLRYQILAAGGILATSISEADLVLFVNAPSANMEEAAYQHNKTMEYSVQRNLVDFVNQIDYVVNTLNKPAAIADVAYSNGGDLELIDMLNAKDLLMKVASYAGWNTSSNTIGTALPHGIVKWLKGDSVNLDAFLASRYIEDVGYCSLVRAKVTNEKLASLNYNYFYVEDMRGKVSDIVKDELNTFVNERLTTIKDNIIINDIYMPWKRMFEIGLDVSYKEKK